MTTEGRVVGWILIFLSFIVWLTGVLAILFVAAMLATG
jgi:hypothetical protein